MLKECDRLTRVDSVEGETTYTYNGNNQLLTQVLNSDTTTYIYDANGQLVTQESTDGKETNYNWDSQGRLTKAEVSEGTSIVTSDYEYDFENIRVAQTVDGEKTLYLIDNSQSFAQIREESAIDGTVDSRYVHALGTSPILMVRNGNSSYYHGDQVDSTRMLTDDTGNVTDRHIYDAFGRVLASIGNTDNRYLYTGEQLDKSTDLNYLRARYLDSNTGRFISRDPFDGILASPISRIAYPYGNNNPVNFTDPSGNVSLVELNVSVGLGEILSNLAPNLIVSVSTVVILREFWKPAFAARDFALAVLAANKDIPESVLKSLPPEARKFSTIEQALILYEESLDLIKIGADLIEAAKETTDLIASFRSFGTGIAALKNSANGFQVAGNIGKLGLTIDKINKGLEASQNRVLRKKSKPKDDSTAKKIKAASELIFSILSKLT